MDIDYAFLQKTLLFRTISEEEIMPLLLALQYRTTLFEKGETILSAGFIADSIGLIVSGGADIQLNDEWGNRTILSHISEGQYFAETYAMLDHAMLPVDVVATEDSKVLFLKADALKQDMPETDAQIAKMRSNMLSLALKKNLALSGRIFHTAPKTIRGKVLAYLTTEARQAGTEIFDIPFDRQQLADYLNLDRTALSKELSKMKKDGLIDYQKNHFKVIAH